MANPETDPFWDRVAQEQGPGYAAMRRQVAESNDVPPALAVAPPQLPTDLQAVDAAANPAPPALAVPIAATPTEQQQPQPTTPPPTVEQPQQPWMPPGPQTVATREAKTQIERANIDPAIQAETAESRARQATAVAKANEIEAAAQKKIADTEAERAAAVAAERERQQKLADQRRAQLDEQMGKIRDAQKELDAVKAPEEDSLGSRMGKAIAIALGQFGASLTGGQNGALAVVEADRNAKIQAWKAQYERMRGKVAGQQNLYAQLREKGLDDATAEAALIQNMNEGYANTIRAVMAGSKAPLTLEQGKADLEKLQQQNLAADQALKGHVTRLIEDKSVTKEGGANTEEKGKLLEQANKDPHIQQYREVANALARFQDLRAGGADGAALAEFIAGKGGLAQGSFTPSTMMAALKQRGIIGKTVEQLRSMFAGGVPPDLMQEIGQGLAASVVTNRSKAQPAIRYFQRQFSQAGIDPAMIVGGETANEAAASVGATPSAYQGQR